MKPVSKCLYITIFGMIVIFSAHSLAQDPYQTVPPVPPPAVAPVPGTDGGQTPAPEAGGPQVPSPPLPWRWQEQYRNGRGEPVAPRLGKLPADGTPVADQQVVTTPHGTMTQTWEASNTDGVYSYRREHRWVAPDGTPIRSQETTIIGTGPDSYQRERIVTLRDGRTIEHNYLQTWDGQTLQTERSFVGPNGQTWNRENTWTRGPDGTLVPTNPSTSPAPEGGGAVAGEAGAEPRANRSSGFTFGSSARNPTAEPRGMSQRTPRPPETTPSLAKRLRWGRPIPDRPGPLPRSTPPGTHGRR
jgi:hypothetical protein